MLGQGYLKKYVHTKGYEMTPSEKRLIDLVYKTQRIIGRHSMQVEFLDDMKRAYPTIIDKAISELHAAGEELDEFLTELIDSGNQSWLRYKDFAQVVSDQCMILEDLLKS